MKKIKNGIKLWNFITHLKQCTKSSFDKYCKEKEVKNVGISVFESKK